MFNRENYITAIYTMDSKIKKTRLEEKVGGGQGLALGAQPPPLDQRNLWFTGGLLSP